MNLNAFIFTLSHSPLTGWTRFYVLVLLFIGFSLAGAQPTNEAIYSQEALKIANSILQETTVGKLEGVITPEIQQQIKLDSTQKEKSLTFYLEEIRFQSLGKGKFARYLQGSVNLVDTVEHPHEFSYSDTLSRKAVNQARKTKVEALKGNNPVLWSKVGIPFLTVTASVGMVIALFYVRTQ